MKYIWTLWWQGMEDAPNIVKVCFESMKTHANGAKVVILDKNTVNEYIDIPEHIRRKFQEGKISITHLSDIIRFQLLYKYGGLWVDSTILVTEDIPDWIYDSDFYTIKNGVGKDDKNIAKGKWTAFLLGGQAGQAVFQKMNQMFSNYWKKHDELVCYFLVDFYLKELYEKNDVFKKQIDDLPSYEGNVFALINAYGDQIKYEREKQKGIFHKLSWKVKKRKGKMDKISSLIRHIKNLADVKMIREWEFSVVGITFLNNVTRSSESKLAHIISDKYNRKLSDVLYNDNKTEVIGESEG